MEEPSFVKLVPNAINFTNKDIVIPVGYAGSQRTEVQIPNVTNGQNININIPLSAGDECLLPHIWMNAELIFTLNNVDPVAQEVGVKALPLNNCINTATIKLTDETFTTPVVSIVEVAPKILPQNVLQRISPHYLYDQSGGAIGTDAVPAAGRNYSVLKDADSAGVFEGMRGSGNVDMQFLRAAGTQLIVRLREELMAAPFAYDKEYESPAFLGQTRLSILLTGMDFLTRVLQLGTGNWNAVTAVTVNRFTIEYYTAKVPATVESKFASIPYMTTRFIEDVGQHGAAVAAPVYGAANATYALASAANEYISPPISVEQNCRKIILWASPTRASRTCFTAEYQYGFRSLQVMYKSQIFFGGWTPQMLWAMSRKNGLNMSYEQWVGLPFKPVGQTTGDTGCGGPIIIDVVEDLSSSDFMAVSEQRTTFSFRANWFNTSPIIVPAGGYTVHALIMHADRFSWITDEGRFQRESDLITGRDMLDAIEMPVTYDETIISARGGNVFKNVSSYIREKALPWLKKNKSTVKGMIGMIPEVGQTINEGLTKIGYGKRGGANITGGLRLM